MMARRITTGAGLTSALLAGALVSLIALPPALGKQPDPSPPASSAGGTTSGEGACDVDGVDVRYGVGFQSSSFRVTSVTVGGISPTCSQPGNTALLTVKLRNGANDLATASGAASGASTTLSLPAGTAAPRAQDVTAVHVELAGGRLPVPSQCAAMTFDHVQIGTNGNDDITSTQRRNIVFGLDGNDTLRGGQQDDCLVGQADNDRLFGEQGQDVLIGGPGADHLDGGNGKDVCVGTRNVDTFVSCETILQE